MNGGSSSSSSAASTSTATVPPPPNFGRSLQQQHQPRQTTNIVEQQVAAAVAAAAAAAGARPPWFQTSPATPNDLALRAAGLYNMRLESLATQMLSLPNAAAAAAAASHLASLQAAANASANGQNLPPSVAYQNFPPSTNAGIPPPPPTCCSVVAPPVTSSQYVHQQHQPQPPPLLNPYLFSAAAAAAYAAQAAAANNAAAVAVARPAQAPQHQIQPAPPPAFLPMDSAFLPANLGLPRYRYHMPTSPLSEATPPGSTPHRNRPPGLDPVAAAAHFRQQQQQQQTQQHHPHFPMRRPSSPTAHLSPNLSIPHLVNHQTPDQQTYNRHFNHRASISGCSIPLVSALDFAARPPPVAAAATKAMPPSAPTKRPGRPSQLPVQPYYPTHFMRGTWIRLASGNLKKVEDLNGEDFTNSADLTQDLKVDISEVVRIDEKAAEETVTLSFAVGEQKLKVTVEATQEHPFFVIGQGWSSYNPEKTKLLYGLNCNKLKTKDCCISLTSRGGLTNHLADAAVNGHCTNVVVSAPPAAPSNQKISPKIKVNNKFSFQNITGAASPIKQNTTVKTGSVSCNGHSTATTINSAVTANVGHKRKNRNINDLAEDLSISAATHQQQGISKTKKFKSPEIVVAPKSSTTNKNFQHRRSSTPILVENRKPSTGRRFSVS